MDYSKHEFLLDEIKNCTGKVAIEFGTYSGNSTINIARQAKKHNAPVEYIYTIDSFEGLPKELEGKNVAEEWIEGAYNPQKYWNANIEGCIDQLYQLFDKEEIPIVILQCDFHELDCIEADPIYDNGRACYINVDCDLYKSTIDALSWVFDYDLLAVNGLIRYDDYHGVENGGEKLAHDHICEKYNLEFEYIDRCVFRFKRRKG